MNDDWDQIKSDARQLWGNGLEPTAETLHAAAVGMAQLWYRNTDAVETLSHAEGPWADVDMLRHNAWVTELCRQSLVEVREALDANPGRILEALLAEIQRHLPSDEARTSLAEEKANAPWVATDWIESNGFGNYLAFLTQQPFYPKHWWGAPRYSLLVDSYCALDVGPPEPETFRQRMLNEPWKLSDAQARFVCTHRYDVP